MTAREEVERDFRRWAALRNITVDRGATEAEAMTAAQLAERLDRKWGFTARIAEARARQQAAQQQVVVYVYF